MKSFRGMMHDEIVIDKWFKEVDKVTDKINS